MIEKAAIGMENDYSQIKKHDLCDSRGVKYYDFIATLKPRYSVVWIQLLSGYLAMALISAAVITAGSKAPHLIPFLVPVSSLLLGYLLSYVMLFTHEASHFNLTRDRRLNDILANIFIGS